MDAYVTVEQADDYMQMRLYADAWNDADEQKRQVALVTATRRIDMQRLRREWTGYDDAPQAVKGACCEEALALLSLTKQDRDREREHALGIVGTGLGDWNEYAQQSVVQRKATGGAGLISPEARQLLGPYMEPDIGRVKFV